MFRRFRPPPTPTSVSAHNSCNEFGACLSNHCRIFWFVRSPRWDGMGVAAVVFGPGGQHMTPELLLAPPGRPLQVIVLERVDQDLPLVQPGGVGGRIARSPPAVALGEVPLRTARYMARSSVLDQEGTS